jgi:hypothetical protein
MGSLIALFIIVLASLIIVRVGATALMMTGISWDTASFQSYSAFFGVGFTTREAEIVVNHPVRRRIIRDLILAGNVGALSALATVVAGFVQASTPWQALLTALGFFGAVLVLWFVAKLPFLHNLLDRIIRASLAKSGIVRALDYEMLLRTRDGYCVSEVEILEDSPLINHDLKGLRLGNRGVLVLGIVKKDGRFFGAPGPDALLEPGDVATVYGRDTVIRMVCFGSSSSEAHNSPATPGVGRK